jgi:hypothetical protein
MLTTYTLERACGHFQPGHKTFNDFLNIPALETRAADLLAKIGSGIVWFLKSHFGLETSMNRRKVALDPDTKLVPCWFVSSRHAGASNAMRRINPPPALDVMMP